MADTTRTVFLHLHALRGVAAAPLRGRGRPHRLRAPRRGRRLLARLRLRRRASPSPTSITTPIGLRQPLVRDAEGVLRADPAGRTALTAGRGRGSTAIRRAAWAGRDRRLHGQSDRPQPRCAADAERPPQGASASRNTHQRRLAGHEPAVRRVVLSLRQRRSRSRSPTSTAPTTSSASAPTRWSRTAAVLTAPDMRGRLRADPRARRQGRRRRPAPHRDRAARPTSTSRSDPGGDAALLLAMVQVLVARRAASTARARPHRRAAGATIERRIARVHAGARRSASTGVPADDDRAPGAASSPTRRRRRAYSRVGVCNNALRDARDAGPPTS